MRKTSLFLALTLTALLVTFSLINAQAQATDTVLVLEIDGPLTPSLAEYLERGLGGKAGSKITKYATGDGRIAEAAARCFEGPDWAIAALTFRHE